MSRQFNHRLDADRTQTAEEDDLLGRAQLARVIARECLGPALGPASIDGGIQAPAAQIIGVYGSWGSGKTFLLDHVVDALFEYRDHPRVSPIVSVFEAWRYEHEGDLAIALAHSLSQVDEQFVGPRQNPPFREEARPWRQAALSLMTVLARSGSSLASAAEPAGQLPLFMLRSTLAAVEAAREQQSSSEQQSQLVTPSIDQVRSEMANLVSSIVDATGTHQTNRVVMLIDDLDRCSPESLVTMLEWLKVHLTVPNITYVLALDHVAAARAIVGRYKNYLGDATDLSYGYRYLEKLVDVEFELGPSSELEAMACQKVFGRDVSTIAQGVHMRVQRDLPSVQEAAELLNFPGLRAPRTCLKIVDRYKRCVDLFETDEGRREFNGLPASWAIWLFVLCAMYYRLSAEEMTEFVRGEGPLVAAWDGSSGLTNSVSEAAAEFVYFAAGWRSRSGGQATRLAPDQMVVLANAVRQLVLQTSA